MILKVFLLMCVCRKVQSFQRIFQPYVPSKYVQISLTSRVKAGKDLTDIDQKSHQEPKVKPESFPLVQSESSIFKSSSFLLNFVAILWGTQHVVIKASLDLYSSTSILIFWRFILSTLLFSPALVSFVGKSIATPLNTEVSVDIEVDKNKNKNKKFDGKNTIKAGVELGIWTFLGFAFQAVGLETTTASRSAFLLYLNVKIVPFLAFVLFGKKISYKTILSCISAFSGTVLLSTDGSPFNQGDIWCIGAAVASALFILRLESFSKENNASEMNAITFGTVAILSFIWVVGDVLSGHSTLGATKDLNDLAKLVIEPFRENALPVIYLGLFATGVGNYLQTLGQRTVPAEKAAIIYSLDPVYGAFFSRLFLGEELELQGYIGGALILLGIWITSQDDETPLEHVS